MLGWPRLELFQNLSRLQCPGHGLDTTPQEIDRIQGRGLARVR